MAIITKPRGQQKERNLQPPMFPHYFLIMAILWKHLVTPGWPQLCKVPSGHIMNVHLCWQSERQETADGWDNREAKVGSSVIALLFRKRMCLTRTKKKKSCTRSKERPTLFRMLTLTGLKEHRKLIWYVAPKLSHLPAFAGHICLRQVWLPCFSNP